ncbi:MULTISPECIES: LysR family transcriptional regulator [Pseudomonas]|uniref:LysR family transcriptional regulator n=1 Tax=Pseudomonas putida TaxID=303 RepID=A0AAD0LFI7_PSEPU|nr:LysR family transcriptional regulator [Pseudomonas putida]AXA27609.1 LysR family transcriptional regulator [Pseudomonas putida]
MRIRHIEVFQAILRTGSLTRAAQALNITQPAASKLLAHAEANLGFVLFERVKGRLQLTREAEILIPAIDKVFRDLDDVRRLSRSLRHQSRGALRIGCIPSLGLKVLPHALAASQRANPELSLDLITAHSEQLAQALLAREISIAFTFNGQPRPGLKVIALHEVELVCHDGTQDQGPVSLDAIDPARIIGLPASDPLGELVRPWLGGVDSRTQVQTYYVACALAQAGAGIALIDEFTADALLPPGQRARRITPRLPVVLTAVVHENAALSKLEKDFMASVRLMAAGAAIT